jgi:hypothetical protein
MRAARFRWWLSDFLKITLCQRQLLRTRPVILHPSKTGRITRSVLAISLILLNLVVLVPPSDAYSVLTHEALIDSAWDVAIKPALLKRFPASTSEDLKNAHAFAYGGSIIQDMGYYPFGSKFFSDLVHYVRSGDFVTVLIQDSQDLDEYAFALGALAHYCADNNGHRLAVNRIVPILYLEMRKKYGATVTYDENPADHLKTEFALDVVQVAKGHYAPDAYHDHIGFQVSRPLLERAFHETYSLDLASIFSDFDLALGTYRRGVSTVIPKMTEVAWRMKKNEIQKDNPGITRREFIYNLSRASYEKNWKSRYQKPGLGTEVLAFLIRFIPKVGPFKALSFRVPTPPAETMFMNSFNTSQQSYEEMIRKKEVTGRLAIENDNFDTGTITGPGEYPLGDSTYADLVNHLNKNHFAQTSPQLRDVLLTYYSNLDAPYATKKNKKKWAALIQQIELLKGMPRSSGTAAEMENSFPSRSATSPDR